jgi:cytochrome c oxidase subunit 3
MSEPATAEYANTPHGPEARVTGEVQPAVDPMPAAKLAMWLFLASEAMFFTGLLGAFIVLSSGEQHELYRRSAHMLSGCIGVASALCLVASSVTLVIRTTKFRWIALGIALFFILLQVGQAWLLRADHTIVYQQGDRRLVQDGNSWDSLVMDIPAHFDISKTTATDFRSTAPVDRWSPDRVILSDNDYGPSRNNFFASYFVLSGAHVLHLIAGMIAVLFYLVRRKGALPSPVQIYWHFVNAAGVICLLAVYFI